MGNIFSAVLYAGLITYGLRDIKRDKDFRIELNSKEYMSLIIKMILSFFVVVNINIWTSIFLIIGMSYMQIATITDKKTKLVNFGYIYVIVPMSVICESIISKGFSCYVLIPLTLSIIVYLIHGYNSGDILFSFLPVAGCYLRIISTNATTKTAALESAIMYWCMILFVAAVMMVAVNIKDKNIKKGIDLKEARAFCPYMLYGTYIVTAGLWMINQIM